MPVHVHGHHPDVLSPNRRRHQSRRQCVSFDPFLSPPLTQVRRLTAGRTLWRKPRRALSPSAVSVPPPCWWWRCTCTLSQPTAGAAHSRVSADVLDELFGEQDTETPCCYVTRPSFFPYPSPTLRGHTDTQQSLERWVQAPLPVLSAGHTCRLAGLSSRCPPHSQATGWAACMSFPKAYNGQRLTDVMQNRVRKKGLVPPPAFAHAQRVWPRA